MPSSLGPAEILVILVVALIVLGPAKLPQAGRQVGKALAELRKWTTDVRSEVKTAFDVEAAVSDRPPSYDDYPDSPLVQRPGPAVEAVPADPPKPVDLTKAAKPTTTPESERL